MRKGLFIIVLLALAAGFLGYVVFLQNNMAPSSTRPVLNIPTGSDFNTVLQLMKERHLLKSTRTFACIAKWRGYDRAVKPGHYVFNRTMSNRELVNMLKSGNQTPVKLVIYNIRTPQEFAGLLGRTLELDSNDVLKHFSNPTFCNERGVDTDAVLSLFVTDNYELFWNVGWEGFLDKMEAARNRFWQGERMAKAAKLGLQQNEIVTLASIVEKECIFDKELPTVAGVYLNRLKIGMPLQADPTLLYALRDFSARRVWNYHKNYDSRYNTYLHAGLPPGPICTPRKKSIDAVLNYETHDYLYFCANPDLSGYSIFSKTLDEQNRVAKMYRDKVNKMGVK
ncbi:MAG: endolytic transglycosylase MltG [Chitinophagales bacterium]